MSSSSSSLGRLIGPLTLLTFCTSFAFNRAALERTRSDEETLHRRRINWLQTVLHKEEEDQRARLWSQSGKERSAWSWAWAWGAASPKQQHQQPTMTRSASHDGDLIRQCLSLSLDPTSLGLPSHLIAQQTKLISLTTTQVQSTTWSQALFGDVNVIKQSFGQAGRKAKEALFGPAQGFKQDDEEEMSETRVEERQREEREEETRIMDWEKRMIEAEAATAAADAAAEASRSAAPTATSSSRMYSSSVHSPSSSYSYTYSSPSASTLTNPTPYHGQGGAKASQEANPHLNLQQKKANPIQGQDGASQIQNAQNSNVPNRRFYV